MFWRVMEIGYICAAVAILFAGAVLETDGPMEAPEIATFFRGRCVLLPLESGGLMSGGEQRGDE